MTLEIGGVRERDLDLALAAALHGSATLRARLLAQAGIESEGHQMECVRISAFTDSGETDVLLVVRLAQAGRCALMIEHKIDAMFQPGQAARYHARGGHGVLGRDWDRFKTLLVAPAALISMQPSADWHASLSLEEIADWAVDAGDTASGFLALACTAAGNKFAAKLSEKSAEATAFWRGYRAFALAILPAGARISRLPDFAGRFAPWPRFHLPGDSSRRELEHKPAQGYVDLTFPKADAEHVAALAAGLLPMGAQVVRASNSAAVRLRVPALQPLMPFSGQEMAVQAALDAVMRLHELDRQLATPEGGEGSLD